MSKRRPNVLILMTDAQRADTLGFASGTACRTPTYERMAREGVHFENTRCTSPICSPTRASIFTGFQPHQAGMPHLPNATLETEDAKTRKMGITKPVFSGVMRKAGYRCYYVGKWHLGDRNIGEWFDEYAAYDGDGLDYSRWCKEQGLPDGMFFNNPVNNPYRSKHPPGMSIPRTGISPMPKGKDWDAWIVSQAMEKINSIDFHNPFLLVCSMLGPHQPWVVPSEYYDMYDPSQIPEPANFHPGKREPTFLKDSYFRMLRNEWGTEWSAWQQSVAVYWAFVTYLDSLMGTIISRIEEAGVLDNTLVVMMSDHAEMMGQHGLWHKMCPYEETIRVPLVMRLPEVIKPGVRCSMDVSHIDIAPTILGAIGLGPADEIPGENLLPYVNGEKPEPSYRDCFVQYNLGPDFGFHKVKNWRVIVRRPWKYIYHESYGAELYNLKDDPGEMSNVADLKKVEHIQAELHQALLKWMEQTEDPMYERITTKGDG